MKKIILLILIALSYMTAYGQCNQGACQNIPINNAQPWSDSHGTPTLEPILYGCGHIFKTMPFLEKESTTQDSILCKAWITALRLQ